MLGKVCLKRLRFVLYAVLFFLLTLDITNRTGDGLIATVCIWLALPLAFIAMVWWIYACVRGTLLLIAGLTLCISASPQSVNRNCPDQKQLACPPDVTVASIYAAFASVDTPLGKPFLGRIKTIDGDVMIWGPNARDEYVYLYRSRSGRYLHLSSNIFPEWITTPIPAGEKKDEPLDMPELLADLCDCIEDYLKTGNVRPL